MKTSKYLLLLAGISVLSLAACGQEQAVTAEAPPASAAQAQPTAPPAEDTTDDALRRLGEGAESIREGAQELAREARERAERALEDAGPALERAGEIAREIGSSINEIVENAMRDFQTGVELLERRIQEATGEQRAPTGDPDAVLPPAESLQTDTRAAARAGPAGVGPAYVGVWAGDATSCARIDQEAVELMAVITPTTIRRYESMCNFPATEMSDGTATLSASCIAEGQTEEREIVLEMPDLDTLSIGQAGVEGSARLVRCRLPQ